MPQSNLPVPHALEARTTEPVDTWQSFHDADMQQVMLDAQFKAGQAYLMLAVMTDKLLPFVEGAPMKIQAFWHRSHCAEWWEEKVRCLH